MNSGSWYWPDVSDLDGAKDATRYGMWCALLVAGVTTLFAVLSLFGVRLMGITPAALLDAALFGAIGFGLSRYSRFAAVAGFLLYLLEKIYALVTTGSILGVGALGVVMLFGFFNGIRGAFAYQKLAAAVPPHAVPPTALPGPS
jgi:hypothetical protein